jgi:hypothetical protein
MRYCSVWPAVGFRWWRPRDLAAQSPSCARCSRQRSSADLGLMRSTSTPSAVLSPSRTTWPFKITKRALAFSDHTEPPTTSGGHSRFISALSVGTAAGFGSTDAGCAGGVARWAGGVAGWGAVATATGTGAGLADTSTGKLGGGGALTAKGAVLSAGGLGPLLGAGVVLAASAAAGAETAAVAVGLAGVLVLTAGARPINRPTKAAASSPVASNSSHNHHGVLAVRLLLGAAAGGGRALPSSGWACRPGTWPRSRSACDRRRASRM